MICPQSLPLVAAPGWTRPGPLSLGLPVPLCCWEDWACRGGGYNICVRVMKRINTIDIITKIMWYILAVLFVPADNRTSTSLTKPASMMSQTIH